MYDRGRESGPGLRTRGAAQLKSRDGKDILVAINVARVLWFECGTENPTQAHALDTIRRHGIGVWRERRVLSRVASELRRMRRDQVSTGADVHEWHRVKVKRTLEWDGESWVPHGTAGFASGGPAPGTWNRTFVYTRDPHKRG